MATTVCAHVLWFSLNLHFFKPEFLFFDFCDALTTSVCDFRDSFHARGERDHARKCSSLGSRQLHGLPQNFSCVFVPPRNTTFVSLFAEGTRRAVFNTVNRQTSFSLSIPSPKKIVRVMCTLYTKGRPHPGTLAHDTTERTFFTRESLKQTQSFFIFPALVAQNPAQSTEQREYTRV